MTWHTSAACRRTNTETFFPTSGSPDAYDDALAVCAWCPVKDACLKAALAEEHGVGVGYRHGYRGGMTPAERHTIDNKRPCAECGGPVPYIRRQSTTCSPECRLLQVARQWAESQVGRRRGLPQSNIARDDDPRHGTKAGWSAHSKTGTLMCADCREVANTMRREHRPSRKLVSA